MCLFVECVQQQVNRAPEEEQRSAEDERSEFDVCSDMADVATQRLVEEEVATKLLRCISVKLQARISF